MIAVVHRISAAVQPLRTRTPPYATIALGALSLLIPFLNYGASKDLIGGDAGIAWALPAEALRHVVGVYIDGPGLGYDGATGLAAAFPALTLSALLHGIGLPTPIVARLIIALYFFLAMSGALALFNALVPPERAGRAPALLAALFYGLNRYTVLLYFTAQTYFPMVYSALPWLLYGVVEGCERHRGRGIAIVVAALLWAGGAGSNPALFGVALCAVAIAAALELAQGISPRRVLTVTGAGAALGLACCAWWLLPLATSVGAGLEAVSAARVPDWVRWMSERSSFFNLFKLDGYTGGDIVPFASWYASSVGNVLGYVPLAVAIAGFGTFRRRLSVVALLAFAVSAFLSKGVHEPFGWVYQLLLDRVPGFSIYRSPYVKWIALEAMLLSLLFFLGAAGVTARLSAWQPAGKYGVQGLLAAVALAIVLLPWPAFAGRMLSPQYNGVGFLSTPPVAYHDVATIVRERARGTVRTIVFNAGAPPYPLYTWGYFGQDPLEVAIGSPVAPFDTLLPMAPYMSADTLARALRSLGVGFVAVHHDVINQMPSPQASALVAAHEAIPLYRSPALDLYAIQGTLDRLAETIRTPLLAVSRSGTVADDRVSENAPQRFDPNAAFMVAQKRPLQVLSVSATTRLPNAVSAHLGWIRDVTDDEVRSVPHDATLAFVRGNPLGVAVTAAHCGRHDGIVLASPSRWRLGSIDLGTFTATLCLKSPSVGTLAVGGSSVDEQRGQFALANGTPLAFDVREMGRVDGVAKRLLVPGLPFGLRVPHRATSLAFTVPAAHADAPFLAAVRTPSGRTVGSAAWSNPGGVAVPFDKPVPAGSRLALFLSNSDAAAYVALQSVRRLPFSVSPTIVDRKWLDIDQRLLRSIPLTHAQLHSPAHEISPLEKSFAHAPKATWSPDNVTPRKAWSIASNRVTLRSSGPPMEVHLTGNLPATSRYRFGFAYRATGYAELWTSMFGGVGEHITHLRADDRWHRFDEDIFPQAGSSGDYTIRLRSSAGRVQIRQPRLAAAGPNGVVLAWKTAAPLGGRVRSVARPFPWFIDVIVDDCAPCMLRIGVSHPGQWRLDGAATLATFTGQGDARGAWAGITTGAATWLIDAGSGSKRIRLLYVPALVALLGAAVALGAAAIMLAVLLRRERPSALQRIVMERTTIPVAFLVLFAVTSLLVAALGAADAGIAETCAAVLWFGIIILAPVEWVMCRRTRRIEAAH